MACSICCDAFNKSTRKPVSCNYCDLPQCLSCVKTFLLGISDDAHCMGCNNAWNREFMDGVLTKVFIDTAYKSHREEVLLEREKALLPETMPYAETESKCRSLGKEIMELYKKQQVLQNKITTFPLLEGDPTVEEELERVRTINAMRLESSKVYLDIDLLQQHKMILSNKRRVDHKKQFVRACPEADCRGFLSSSWKCGMCEVWVCPDCHESIGKDKNAEHTCDPGNVETAKLLAKDTKACPKCAAMIFKISGCAQMFCTQCHTVFSWQTGQVETGRIHNPHYYEYQRQINNGEAPREIGDAVCGGMPDVRVVQNKLYKIYNKRTYARIDFVCQLHAHIEIMELPRFRVDGVQDNRDLRIQYLLNDIDEDAFKKQLQSREKQNNKNREILMVLQMFLDTSADIMRRFVADAKTVQNVTDIEQELNALREYATASFEKIGKRYKCVPKKILPEWKFA